MKLEGAIEAMGALTVCNYVAAQNELYKIVRLGDGTWPPGGFIHLRVPSQLMAKACAIVNGSHDTWAVLDFDMDQDEWMLEHRMYFDGKWHSKYVWSPGV